MLLLPCGLTTAVVGKARKRVEQSGPPQQPHAATADARAGCRSEGIVLSGSADVYRRIEVIPSAAATLAAGRKPVFVERCCRSVAYAFRSWPIRPLTALLDIAIEMNSLIASFAISGFFFFFNGCSGDVL